MNSQALIEKFLAEDPGVIRDLARQTFAALSDEEALDLLWDWRFWGRKEQLEPIGDWDIWLILSGRGWGKTRTGAETVRSWAEQYPGCRIALVGATAADVRDTMIEGESGLLAVCPPWFRPHYEPSKRRVTFPNGTVAQCFSAEEPDRLRGPQFHFAWCDELSSWPEPNEGQDAASSAWNMLRFCVRLQLKGGDRPRIVVTTTPKPTDTIVKLATKEPRVCLTEGHTFDNAGNLAEAYIRTMRSLYHGTRLGSQELAGKLLLDTPGALFQAHLFYETAVPAMPCTPVKTVIAVDPGATSNEGNDATGISVLSLGEDDEVYVLEDATMKGTPDEWARAAVDAYKRHGASYIVAEANVGGEMVETTIHTVDLNVPVQLVRAMKGKAKRAEPVAAKLEQRKIHLVGSVVIGEDGPWSKFLFQAKRFTGINGKRDDRVDAFCWGVHDLCFTERFAFV